MARTYNVTALELTIWFNREGDHDHNGLIYVLDKNLPLVRYLKELSDWKGDEDKPPKPPICETDEARDLALKLQMPFPTTPRGARQPHPIIRPLVLRCNLGETVEVCLKNEIEKRAIGIHLVGGGYDVVEYDGSQVGGNDPSLAPPSDTATYKWRCDHEGVFPFHDGGDYSGGEDGTNVHGLFGALAVEPAGAIWRDPITGEKSGKDNQLDGLYLDIIPPKAAAKPDLPVPSSTLKDHTFRDPVAYPNFREDAHREFVIFFHDEPEFLPPHKKRLPDPCDEGEGHGSGHGGGHGGGHGDLLPIMPISYRAEPMVNREQTLFKLMHDGHDFKGRPVLNEEQHHSSWMFGDPVTPILRAYIGDPVRIRFVHAAVKETHVFHLHLYEWHAVPEDKDSPRIDAISVSPQTAHTIEPIWGAGNRHQVAGDVIWHCHLYPHFHEGMWGMFRTFETLQEGPRGNDLDPVLSTDEHSVYKGRRLNHYPDGSPIQKLLVLPGREPPPRPTVAHPGYPLYIPGELRQKSPIPPWPGGKSGPMPADHDYRLEPTELERNAFNKQPVPGELFTRRPFAVGQRKVWPEPKPGKPPSPYDANSGREVSREIAVDLTPIAYNGYGWHDKHGHLYYLTADGRPSRLEAKEPLFFRAQHGQILNLTLRNDLPLDIPATEFDHEFPPCPERPWQGECAPHVHMVKFDPICADGASVGWNYMSGPVAGKKMRYRWWLDQEFGTIFFHDHLFANYRQKHGLFGALLVEPIGARFFHPTEQREIVSGLQARIDVPGKQPKSFREFCIGIGDFIPMWDRNGEPLNPPATPGGHGDQGVMALNYRSDPIHERLEKSRANRDGEDPANWFTSGSPYNRDPYTVRFDTISNDPIWFRAIQGSHEEQHSFQVHGMRWRRFRGNFGSAVRNQQTFGIAEAFTFVQNEAYKPGDYMYKLSSSDDLWLGCWGLIRAFDKGEKGAPLPLKHRAKPLPLPGSTGTREFRITALKRPIVYRDPDLVDPCGLFYCLDTIIGPDGKHIEVRQNRVKGQEEPLILRCREGETVKIVLTNGLPDEKLEPEPFAPEVPVEERNPFSHRPERRVSSQVSMHADLLRYDVKQSDGANVGLNPNTQTAAPGKCVTYSWETHRPVMPDANKGEALGPLLLQDMADFRNHRHHGLIGALIVEPRDARPLYVEPGQYTADPHSSAEAWDGPRATVFTETLGDKKTHFEEAVLLMQDGLRHFLRGNLHSPISDEPPAPGEDDVDHEDQGQKGFNYRSEPIERRLDNPKPATPVFHVPPGSRVRLHLIGANDKPRNQSFTVHGVLWPEWRFLENDRPMVASESAVTTGTARIFEFDVEGGGDYAYRSGVLKWAVPQGLWGILRVGPKPDQGPT